MKENHLLDAVDALTEERQVRTVVPNAKAGKGPKVHTETHPPLLVLLIEGTGITRKEGGSGEVAIPIDADALEMEWQIRDCIRLWSKKLGVEFDPDDLLGSIRRWYSAHMLWQETPGKGETHRDVTRMVQGWVRMIESKFEPDEKREWTHACPAWVPYPNADGDGVMVRRCGVRRIVVNGDERFAIQLNVTKLTAECARCGTKWIGEEGLTYLASQTDAFAAEQKEAANV